MPPLTKQRAPRAGFTLMELLIVVALIGLLATLLLPVLERATSQARAVRCLSNEVQVFRAVKIYSVSYDSWYPAPAFADTQPDTGAVTDVDDSAYFWGDREDVDTQFYWYESHNWRGKILSYLGASTGDVPEALKSSKQGGYFERKAEKAYDVFRCTVVYGPPPYTSYKPQTYGLNAYAGIFVNPQRLHSDMVRKDIPACHPETMTNTAGTLAIGENWDSHWAVKPNVPRNPADFAKITVEGKQIYAGEVIARHRGRANWIYFDGHGEAMEIAKTDDRQCYLWLPDKPE